MNKWITCVIKAVDPLKIGAFDRDMGNENAHNYIGGSVIRGALIYKWLQRFGGTPPVEFLNGDLRAYNAYPYVKGELLLPTPSCFGGDKKAMRYGASDMKVKNLFTNEVNENIVPYRIKQFASINKESMSVYSPKMVDKLHINKQSKDSSNTKMFRYEAIDKGEVFFATLSVPEKYAKDVVSLFEKEVFYLGGSRNSGYGRVTISEVKCLDTFMDYKKHNYVGQGSAADHTYYLYFASDTILYEGGRVISVPSALELKESLAMKQEPTLKKVFINIGNATNYNSMYKTNTVNYGCVVKGSIVAFSTSETIDEEAIQTLEERGMGLRREDGYGQVLILKSLPDTLSIKELEQDWKTSLNQPSYDQLEPHEQKIVYLIAKETYKGRLDLKKKKLITLLLKDIKIDGKVNSQVGKLMTLLDNQNAPETVQKNIADYLEHMEKKSGLVAWHKLSKVRFNSSSLNLQKLLQDYTKNTSNSVFEELDHMDETVKIGKVIYPGVKDKTDQGLSTRQDFLLQLITTIINMKGETL